MHLAFFAPHPQVKKLTDFSIVRCIDLEQGWKAGELRGPDRQNQ